MGDCLDQQPELEVVEGPLGLMIALVVVQPLVVAPALLNPGMPWATVGALTRMKATRVSGSAHNIAV
jgi:hypothetical protein